MPTVLISSTTFSLAFFSANFINIHNLFTCMYSIVVYSHWADQFIFSFYNLVSHSVRSYHFHKSTSVETRTSVKDLLTRLLLHLFFVSHIADCLHTELSDYMYVAFVDVKIFNYSIYKDAGL